jgi:hypothetical protein
MLKDEIKKKNIDWKVKKKRKEKTILVNSIL